MECRCPRKRCYKRKLGHDLQRFLQIFWSLEKSAQDLYVWVSACAKRYPNVSFSLCQKNPKDIFKIFQNMHVRSYKSQPVSACAIIMWVSACATRYLQNNHVSLSLCYKISSKWSCEPQPVIQDIFKIIMWVSAYAKRYLQIMNEVAARVTEECWKQSWISAQVAQVAGNSRQGLKRRWFLMNQRMGPKCIVAILGLGNGRMNRLISGQRDRRLRFWGGGPLTKLERIIFNLSIGP